MTVDDDQVFSFYNQALLALAAQAEEPRRVRGGVCARAISPICGSEVEICLLIYNDRVVDIGYEVEACALTKTVVSVLQKAAIGKTRDEIASAGRSLEEMLGGGAVMPSGDWAELRILAPVRDYKARHNAILLPFEAVEKAFENFCKSPI